MIQLNIPSGTDSVPLLTTLTVYGIFGVIRLLAGKLLRDFLVLGGNKVILQPMLI